MDNLEVFHLITQIYMPEAGQGLVIRNAADEVALFKVFTPWQTIFEGEFNIRPAVYFRESG